MEELVLMDFFSGIGEVLELFKEPRSLSIDELQPLIINTILNATIDFFMIFHSFLFG